MVRRTERVKIEELERWIRNTTGCYIELLDSIAIYSKVSKIKS